jgi:hypothetical protein
MRMNQRAWALTVALSLTLAPTARAEEPPPAPSDEPAPARDAAQVARDGTFNPETVSARIGDQHVSAIVTGGYDTTSTAQGGNVNALVEGALYHTVALRVGVNSLLATGDSISRNVYSVGLRVGVLRQERHGIDLGVGFTYKSTGFTETTGEIEFMVSLARRWNRLAAFANLVYGQGFISNERDGEVRLGVLYALTQRLNVGVDGVSRFDLGRGAGSAFAKPGESDFELLVGPVATLALGPVVLLAQAGSHTLFIDQSGLIATGFAGLAGVGTAF